MTELASVIWHAGLCLFAVQVVTANGRYPPIAAFRSSTMASQAFCPKELQSGHCADAQRPRRRGGALRRRLTATTNRSRGYLVSASALVFGETVYLLALRLRYLRPELRQSRILRRERESRKRASSSDSLLESLEPTAPECLTSLFSAHSSSCPAGFRPAFLSPKMISVAWILQLARRWTSRAEHSRAASAMRRIQQSQLEAEQIFCGLVDNARCAVSGRPPTAPCRPLSTAGAVERIAPSRKRSGAIRGFPSFKVTQAANSVVVLAARFNLIFPLPAPVSAQEG
jgi:hypothetical protein